MADQSITITFCSEVTEEDQALVVELDDEMNNDKTQFLYGEKAYFKIYKYPSSLSLTITPSDGTIASEGSGTDDEEENITFVNTDTASSSKPVKSISSYSWLGNSLGAVSGLGTTVNASNEGVGVLKLDYKSDFVRYSITIGTQSEEEYPIVVFILGE